MTSISFSAAVLAGGKAERMSSQDKGLLLYQAKPMALRVSFALQGVVDEVFINANRNIESYADLGFAVIEDDERYKGKGPLSGLFTCLTFAKTSHLLVSPCDTPCVSSAAFESLMEAAKVYPAKIHYLQEGYAIHPLHAVLPVAETLSALSLFLENDNRRSVMAFYEVFGCASVEWRNGTELLNVNTPSQLA